MSRLRRCLGSHVPESMFGWGGITVGTGSVVDVWVGRSTMGFHVNRSEWVSALGTFADIVCGQVGWHCLDGIGNILTS